MAKGQAGVEQQIGAGSPGAASGEGAASALRAQPPQPPPLPRSLEQERARAGEDFAEGERLERRSVVRGLVLLALLALLAGIARAGLGRVFVHGWWREW